MNKKSRILFICTHNSTRSQIAEGLINSLWSDKYEAFSAGTEPTRINSYAVQVMKEAGIDISRQSSKNIQKFQGEQFDYVITVCDEAKETCPFFPGKHHLHKSFKDPSQVRGTKGEILAAHRSTREEIKKWLENIFL